MRFTHDHFTTQYQSIGRHDSSLLLLHGWGNSWEAWAPLIPQLSRRHRLIIPDLPGFGQSDSPSQGWGMAEYVTWLGEFLRGIEVSSLTAVLGHSFGGKLAAFGWWGEHDVLPPVEKGFFLVDPSGIINELPLARRAVRGIVHRIPRSLKRGALASLRKTLYTRVLQETDYYSATAFQEETLNRILDEDVRQNCIEKDWPLHFCWGERDTETPLWMAYEFMPLSTVSDVFVVPRSGHFPHHEQPELVRRWLEANKL